MKRFLAILCVLISIPVFAQGGVVITADTAGDILSLTSFGPGRATDAAFSPNGKLLAVSSANGVRLYETSAFGEGDLLNVERAFPAGSVAFYADGSRVVTTNVGYNLRVYDVNTGEILFDAYPDGLDGAFGQIAVAPDGSSFAVGNGDVINVFDSETFAQLYQATGHTSNVTDIEYTADSSRIATGSLDSTVNIWNALTGEHIITLTGHSDAVTGIGFNPDGSQLASTSLDGSARLWDTQTGAQLNIYESGVALTAGDVNREGTMAVLGNADGRVDLVSGVEQAIVATFSESGGRVLGLHFSADGTQIAVVRPGQVQLFDVAAVAELNAARYEPAFRAVAVSRDGAMIAAGGEDGMVYVYGADGALLNTFTVDTAPVTGLAFTIESPTLYVAGGGPNIQEFDLETGEEVGFLEGLAGVVDMTSHPTISMINAAMSDGSMRWWSTETGDIFGTTTAQDVAPSSATAFSPDGRYMASADLAGTILIWDVPTGDVLFTLDGANAGILDAAFSHDGEMLVAGLDSAEVGVWRLDSPAQPVLRLGGFFGGVAAVEFSPDDTVIAAGSLDATVRFFSAATGEEYISFFDHNAPVLDVAFSPDGTRLYSAGEDGQVIVFGVPQ